jgi:hypothetical protein
MNRDVEGIAPRDKVFETGPGLPGQVFAAEVLTRPVVLRRSGGELEVHVDRRGVTQAVYTTEGKNRLCRDTLQGDTLELAARLDEHIHAFVMNARDGSVLEIPTDRIPLRWASGGVLPVVTWRGGVWSPFFFRDIPPVGWNIAAGSSEAEAELSRPVSFGLREFVEETIVLSRPPRAGVEITPKTFPNLIKENDGQMRRALETVNQHLEIRSREDDLELPPFPEGDVPADRTIEADFAPTRTRLHITGDDGESEITDVLVCFNLLELGIEVMSVVRFELGDEEYLLDGEMLTPVGGKVELIRMPVAMISHSYLEDVFGGGRQELYYETPPLIDYDAHNDVWKQSRAGQPSVKVPRPPAPSEIAVFGWDVDRRAELASGPRSDDSWKRDPMRIRHRKWGKTFSGFFTVEQEVGPPREAYPYFTAGSAKTVAYYYSQAKRGQ